MGLAIISEPMCTKNGVKNTGPQVSILFQTQSDSEKCHKVNHDEVGRREARRNKENSGPSNGLSFFKGRENRRKT